MGNLHLKVIMRIPVSLPCGVSVKGSTFSNGRILATDGFECSVYSVDECCCLPTKRPYGFITALCNCGKLLALSGSCSNKIYTLSECLTEIDGFTPKINNGPLLSVYPSSCGNLLALTYRDGCYLTDREGNASERMKTAEEGVTFISCYPLCNGHLLAYNDGDRDVIEYTRCGSTSRCVLPSCVKIKSFAPCEDGVIYGLFGKGYPYTFLSPVLENGHLNCLGLA